MQPGELRGLSSQLPVPLGEGAFGSGGVCEQVPHLSALVREVDCVYVRAAQGLYSISPLSTARGRSQSVLRSVVALASASSISSMAATRTVAACRSRLDLAATTYRYGWASLTLVETPRNERGDTPNLLDAKAALAA